MNPSLWIWVSGLTVFSCLAVWLGARLSRPAARPSAPPPAARPAADRVRSWGIVERSYRIRCAEVEAGAEALVDTLRERGFAYREALPEEGALRARRTLARVEALLDEELGRTRWHQRIGFDIEGFVARRLLPAIAAEYDAFRTESLASFRDELERAGAVVPGATVPELTLAVRGPPRRPNPPVPVAAAGVGGVGAAGVAALFGSTAAGAAMVALPAAVVLGGAWALFQYRSVPALKEQVLAAAGAFVRAVFHGEGRRTPDGTRIEPAIGWLATRAERIEERLIARIRSERERTIAELERRLAGLRSELDAGQLRWADVATPEDAVRLLETDAGAERG